MRQEPGPEEIMCMDLTTNISMSRTSPQTHSFLLTLGQITPDNLLTLTEGLRVSRRALTSTGLVLSNLNI